LNVVFAGVPPNGGLSPQPANGGLSPQSAGAATVGRNLRVAYESLLSEDADTARFARSSSHSGETPRAGNRQTAAVRLQQSRSWAVFQVK
jgi:hypothetical protein